MRKLFSFLILSLMVTVTVLGAQTGQSATMHLKGKVLDSTALPMQSTTVKVYRGADKPKEGTAVFKEGVTDGNGDFDIEVPPGDYYVEVSAPDFEISAQTVKAVANMQPLAVTMQVKAFATEIEVKNDQGGVGIDQADSLMTDTITGDALLDLPDNEEDLLAYLTELAAARGLVDGELDIRVDGFGQSAFLPNRNEIAEIRIVNTSFDAAGGGTGPRIEIITRPGSGVWRGNVGFTFADESMNAAAPLTNRKPASQTRNIDAQLSGPILPGRIQATFNVRNQESDSEGSAIRAVTVFGPVNSGISRIQRSRTITFSPNITINKVHQLNTRFTIGDSRTEGGGIGGFTLPERGTDNTGDNWSMQFTETANLKATLRNEFRVQLQSRESGTVPITNEVAVNVQDAFNGGGAPNRSLSRTQDYIIGNTVRWQASRTVNLTMAGEMNYHKSHNDSRNNYLGTYTFAGLHDYCFAENFPGTNCEETRTIVNDANANGTIPTYLNGRGDAFPITGVPTQFRITIGNPVVEVKQAEYAAYIQGEWRAATRAQISFGARYQAQQHLNDYNNIAPTFGLSYQLNTKQNWQTVVRVGGRMNYQTYSMGNWEQLLRSSGAGYQTDFLVLNPAYPLPDMSNLVAQVSNTATTQRIRADDYVSGYSMQPSLSVDQQLPRGHRLSFNFQISRGVHQTRSRNINAPFPGTMLPTEVLAMLNYRNPLDAADQQAVRTQGRAIVDAMRPDPTVGNISQSESSGSSLTKNFSIQYRVNNKRILWNKVMIGGTVSWNMNWATDNSGTPVNNYDLAAEWGRSSNDQRHRVTGSVNIQVPWNMRFSFQQVGYSSGRPYTVTLGSDLNGDGSNNDRPQGFGRNSETGPAVFSAINMTATKIIPLGGGARRPTTADDYAEPQRGGGGFGGGGGGGFGGGGGGNRNTGGRQIEIGVSVSNLFNSTIRSGISGVLSSSLYGQPTGGGQGRRITLNIRTNLGQLF